MDNKKRRSSSDKTRQYKVQPSKKTRSNRDEDVKVNKKGKKKKHSKLKKVILILFVLIFLTGLAGVGAFAGIFFSDTWAITKEELISNGNTEVYDSQNKIIAVLKAGDGDGNRKVIALEDMGKYTANAYVSIEDKRFYDHSGVDILRTAKATLSYILHRGSSDVGGGSTITQQLVKNLMKDKADTGTAGMERKIREMSRAYHIENMLDKNQILEKYLNIIFVGGNDYHGIEYGAQYYFAKSAKDLDLAESAFMAGINNAPNMYSPYNEENDHSELIKKRTKMVLDAMKDQNRISDNAEEAEKLYNEAVEKVEKGLPFKQGKIEIGSTSYFVKVAVDDVAEDLAEEKDIDFDEAKSMISSGGYKLYTTQVSSIQNTLIKEMAKDTYVAKKTYTEKDENGKNKKVTTRTNAGMTIIEHSTGKVVALAGDLQQDSGGTYTNYATVTRRQTGSSIKPLANVAPGLEEKVITAATVYDDTPTTWGNYKPKNVGSYYGLCTVRKSIERSSNIVNLKIMTNVGIDKSVEYLNDFGLTTYEKGKEDLPLAIGGVSHSSSTVQMAAAYAALANGGEYIEPTFYTALKDSDGKTILEPKQEKRRVISKANAFIISDILTDVVTGAEGTASPCAISGMDVAAKTGTTDYADNKWLCGYTPYYAAATWYGFGAGAGSSSWTVPSSKVNSARSIWANVMKSIHKDLKKARFEKPDDVVTAKICRQSGKLATSECKSTYTEYFAKGTVPKACDGHTVVKICKETKKVATQYCTETEEKLYTQRPEKERNASWKSGGADKYKVPTETCDKHTEETSKITIVNVVGKTEIEARLALTGLTVQKIEGHDSSKANGIVLKQSLEAGTKVDKGVSIIITVNKVSGGTITPPGGGTSGGTTTPPGGDSSSGGTTTPPSGGTSGGSTTTPSGGGSSSGGTTTTPSGGASSGGTTNPVTPTN